MKEARREKEQMERETAMIDAAEALFCRNGYEHTSMDDLARETEFTKRTLYRYFTSKEDLFFAVATRGYGQLREKMRSKKNKGKSGYEKIRLSYDSFLEFYNETPELLSIILMKSAVESDTSEEGIPYKEKFIEMDTTFCIELVHLFEEAKEDGSLRQDKDVKQLAFSTIFMAIGFFHLYSTTGTPYTKYYGLDESDFIRLSMDMLIQNLCNPDRMEHCDLKGENTAQ